MAMAILNITMNPNEWGYMPVAFHIAWRLGVVFPVRPYVESDAVSKYSRLSRVPPNI